MPKSVREIFYSYYSNIHRINCPGLTDMTHEDAINDALKALREIIESKRKDKNKGNGKGCKCEAWSSMECGCKDVSWEDNTTHNQVLDDLLKEFK